MLKLVAFASVATLVGLIPGETDMKLTGPDGVTGSASVKNTILDNGGKYVQITMQLRRASQNVTVMQESSYDPKGTPLRKIQVTTYPGGGGKQTLVANFEKDGAKVTGEAGGKEINVTVPYPAGKSIRAISEFWFIRDVPAPGAVSTYWRFDLGNQSWVETKSTYQGRRKLKIGAQTFDAHLITVGEGRAYLTNSGDPLRLEQGSITMERS